MTRPIRVVKKEIRILGLDFCYGCWVPGVVLRGGQFLDGVVAILNCALDGRAIARQVNQSRYYQELRALMIHDPKEICKPQTLQRVTRLPVIQVFTRKPESQARMFHSPLRGRLWLKTSLPDETLRHILSLTWVSGSLPEPVRAAHLLGRVQNKPPSNSKN